MRMSWDEILAFSDADLNRALDAALGVQWVPSTFHKVAQWYECSEERWDEQGRMWRECLLSSCDYTPYTAHWERTMPLALSWGVGQEYFPYTDTWMLHTRWKDRALAVQKDAEPHEQRMAICRCVLWAVQAQEGSRMSEDDPGW